MKRIVFDTDGLIKLTCSGILQLVPFVGHISAEVYHEAVVEGKKKSHQDAFVIGQMVSDGKISVKEVKSGPLPRLGKGESSAVALYHKIKAEVIVSDDRKFLAYLDEQGVPFLVHSEYLLFLALSKQVKKKDAVEALEKIKNLITIQNYYDAKGALED